MINSGFWLAAFNYLGMSTCANMQKKPKELLSGRRPASRELFRLWAIFWLTEQTNLTPRIQPVGSAGPLKWWSINIRCASDKYRFLCQLKTDPFSAQFSEVCRHGLQLSPPFTLALLQWEFGGRRCVRKYSMLVSKGREWKYGVGAERSVESGIKFKSECLNLNSRPSCIFSSLESLPHESIVCLGFSCVETDSSFYLMVLIRIIDRSHIILLLPPFVHCNQVLSSR